MKKSNLIVVAIVAGMSLLTSCRTLEKASMHGFSNGFYKLDSGGTVSEVYVDVSGENLDVYPQQNKTPDTLKRTSFSLMNSQTPAGQNLTFRKQSLDIDLTTILLKYRMPVSGLPSQLTSDLNIALYAG